MAEWDEEGDEKDMEEFTTQPELQWGFMGDADDGKSQPPGFKIPQTLRLFINNLRSGVFVTLVSNPSGMTAPSKPGYLSFPSGLSLCRSCCRRG